MSLFGLNISGWTVAGALAALVAVLFCILSYRLDSAQTEAKTWRKLAESARSEAALLAKERDSLTAALAEREKKIKAVQVARQSLEQKKMVVRNDEDSRTWASSPLPDNVRGMLTDGR